MENLSCQDILRHGSPFRQGGFVNLPLLCGVSGPCRDASGSPNRGAFHLSLSSCIFLPFFIDPGGSTSVCICIPLLFPAGSASSVPSVPGCVIPPTSLSPSLTLSLLWCVQGPGPLSLGLQLWGPPFLHCVLPEASARTRCRLMASSRKPATFSLSSSFMKA